MQDEIKKKGTKLCGKCKRHRKVKFFPKSTKTKCGYSSWCTKCYAQYNKENYPRFKRRRKEGYYKYHHGVGFSVFEAKVKKQKNRCAICKQRMKRPHFDHNHLTGKHRDALCHKCNVGLGHFNDNPKLLRKALKYLERHK